MIQVILSDPQVGFAMLFMIILAISFHEMAHAWASLKCGDDTAARLGRLTLNPVAHFDPMGIMMIVLVGFGWGKPVPVDPRFLKDIRRDSMFIAAAGPISNVIQAAVLALLFHIITLAPVMKLFFAAPFGHQVWSACILVFEVGVYFNFLLAFFNLIPLFPLDGDKILVGMLPYEQARAMEDFRPHATMVLMGVLMAEFFVGIPIIRTYLAFTAVPFCSLFLGFNPFGGFI